MKRFFSVFLILVLLLTFCSCTQEQPTTSGAQGSSPATLQGVALFEPLGITSDLLAKCTYQTTSETGGTYSFQENGSSLTIRYDDESRITYLLYSSGDPEEKEPSSLETLVSAIDAIRAEYDTDRYQQRTDLWPLYTDGDDSVTLEYTMRYGDVWNYQESMAFRLDLEQGVLTEFSWKNTPPVSAEWTATQEDALSAAEDWIANEKYLPLAEAQVLLPSALAEATDPRVDSVFLDGSPAYLVQYTIEMPWDPAAFQGKELPEEPIMYGIWVSGTDGQALQDGIITEFFAEKTALPYL